MDNIERKEKIIFAIEQCKQNGYTLVTKNWGNDCLKCVCAMGCLLKDGNKEDIGKSLMQMLDVDSSWINDFVDGFDNVCRDVLMYKDAYDLGKEIYELYKPISYEKHFKQYFKEK